MKPYLTQILLFPIKSLDGIAVSQATVLPSGALQGDREFAILDATGKFVNAKRNARIHQLRARFDLSHRGVTLHRQDTGATSDFNLDGDRVALNHWLSDFFGCPVQVVQNTQVGFPDDTASPGPTLVSMATLQRVTTWFPDLSLESIRLRLRTNLEIDGVEPFWEDRLYGEADSVVPFQLGSVPMQGINPCQRCIVPTRDAITGEPYPQFQSIFATNRQTELPEGVTRSRFNHFYRVAVNTRIPAAQAGMVIRIGDELKF